MRLKRAVHIFLAIAALAAPVACGIDLLASGDGAQGAGDSSDGQAPGQGSGSTDAAEDGTQYLIPPTIDPIADSGLDVNNENCLASCPEGGVASCDAGWCVFDCKDDRVCMDRVICPPGIPCAVQCGAKNSCANGVDCMSGSACRITCDGESSCDTKPIGCSGLGCQVDCTGTQACHEGVSCDASTCAINCTGSDACHDGTTQCTGESCTIRCGTANKKEMTPPCDHNVVCDTTKLCDIGCIGDGTCPNEPIIARSGSVKVQCTGDDTCPNGSVVSGVDAGVLCTGARACGHQTYCDAGSCAATCQDDGFSFCCLAGPGKCKVSMTNCTIDDAGCK